MARWRVIASVRDDGAQGAWRGHTCEIEAGPERPSDLDVGRALRDRGLETYHVASVVNVDADDDPHADIGYTGRPC